MPFAPTRNNRVAPRKRTLTSSIPTVKDGVVRRGRPARPSTAITRRKSPARKRRTGENTGSMTVNKRTPVAPMGLPGVGVAGHKNVARQPMGLTVDQQAARANAAARKEATAARRATLRAEHGWTPPSPAAQSAARKAAAAAMNSPEYELKKRQALKKARKR